MSPVEPSPHERRDLAEGFGANARRYDRARPGYPAALVHALLEGSPGPRVLDVGIGTGLSSRLLRDAGCRVLGVDVDERMARVAREHGFDVEVEAFERWDPAGRVFDLVVAGQTWHWVDPVAGAAKVAWVLRAGGRFAAFWNVGDPSPHVAAAFADVYRRVDTGLPFTPWAASAVPGYAPILAKAIDGLDRSQAFDEPQQWRFGWQAGISTSDWLDQVPTAGGHNQIAPDTLQALLDGMGEVIDAAGGSFTMDYTTLALTAVRR